MNGATNVGRFFLNLINKHSPPQHKFSKIFNRNNMKISYSCMPNIKSRINIHNKKVTKAKPSAQTRTCKCINKLKCPLNNKCLSNNVLYKANITSESENYRNKIYYGMSETKFKSRYANHRKSFKKQKLQNRHWTFQWNLEVKGTKQKCGYIVGNSRDKSVVQRINKTMHVTSKRKISNSAPQRR